MDDRGGVVVGDHGYFADNEAVFSPSHYTAYNQVEVIEITRWLLFDLGNSVKYIVRAGLKDPAKEDQDLLKALWYVNDHISKVEPKVGIVDPRAVMDEEMRAIFEWKVQRLCDQLSYERSLAVMAIVNGNPYLASAHITSEYLKVRKEAREAEEPVEEPTE